ncbi:uncharacterized protein MKZ38_004089 [Zalerion maritima]|uniref:Uncharacterized protein n=1 Tax=Zalerion maritima TaxID=339359 RepID=A0AAD5RYK2_9PEZI|nr:uncharacterized protein MKZ38_004089 [Zalerion maritima]
MFSSVAKRANTSVHHYGPNYLVSLRSFQSVVLTDGTSGDPIWILGGKLDQFKAISPGGNALTFPTQHHARLRPGNMLTMFDNHIEANIIGCTGEDCSRALKLKLDLRTMTGTQPAIAKYKGGSGEAVMDLQLGPRAEGFLPGVNVPYRAFKLDSGWADRAGGPVLLSRGRKVYVTWNGATKVAKWVVSRDVPATSTTGAWTPPRPAGYPGPKGHIPGARFLWNRPTLGPSFKACLPSTLPKQLSHLAEIVHWLADKRAGERAFAVVLSPWARGGKAVSAAGIQEHKHLLPLGGDFPRRRIWRPVLGETNAVSGTSIRRHRRGRKKSADRRVSDFRIRR